MGVSRKLKRRMRYWKRRVASELRLYRYARKYIRSVNKAYEADGEEPPYKDFLDVRAAVRDAVEKFVRK